MSRPEVYLDYQASTPCDPAVIEAMLPYLLYETANPASSHRAGVRAQTAIDLDRERVADALGCFSSEVFFTSGATESNNLVILGCAVHDRKRSGILTTAVEHKSVLESCHELSRQGRKLAICPVKPDGRVDISA